MRTSQRRNPYRVGVQSCVVIAQQEDGTCPRDSLASLHRESKDGAQDGEEINSTDVSGGWRVVYNKEKRDRHNVGDGNDEVDLENDSNGFVVYHKDDKELKKVQKLLGDL